MTKQLTYRQLLEYLKEIPEDRLNDNVTLFDHENWEYFPAGFIETAGDNDGVLDLGHMYIVFNMNEEDL